MTEHEWLTGTDPTPMLQFLRGKASDRKLRLFGCGCCRLIWSLVEAELSQRAVETVEEYVDGRLGFDELSKAWNEAADFAYGLRTATRQRPEAVVQAAFAAADTADIWNAETPEAATAATFDAALGASDSVARACPNSMIGQSAIINCVFGNPFRPMSLDPSWLTSTVVSLAEAIYADRAFDRLPILADALEDAGCDNAAVLNHLRGEGPHVRGCWVLDLVLGTE